MQVPQSVARNESESVCMLHTYQHVSYSSWSHEPNLLVPFKQDTACCIKQTGFGGGGGAPYRRTVRAVLVACCTGLSMPVMHCTVLHNMTPDDTTAFSICC